MLPNDFNFQQLQNASGLQDWLRRKFVDNLRYDRFVSDLLAASGNRSLQNSAWATVTRSQANQGAVLSSQISTPDAL